MQKKTTKNQKRRADNQRARIEKNTGSKRLQDTQQLT
jgi:hypothetical protein